MSSFYGKSIGIVFLTRLRQGHNCNFTEKIIYMFWWKISHFPYPFLSLSWKNSPPSLSSLPSRHSLLSSPTIFPNFFFFHDKISSFTSHITTRLCKLGFGLNFFFFLMKLIPSLSFERTILPRILFLIPHCSL